jgi:hypothetical protein
LSNLPLVAGKGYGASALQSKEPARATRAETSTTQHAGAAGLTRGGRECNRECVVRLSTSRSLAGIPLLPSPGLPLTRNFARRAGGSAREAGDKFPRPARRCWPQPASPPPPPPFGGCTVGKSGRSSRVFPRQSRRPQERAIPNKPNREGKLVSSGFLERACACARVRVRG